MFWFFFFLHFENVRWSREREAESLQSDATAAIKTTVESNKQFWQQHSAHTEVSVTGLLDCITL